MLTHRHALAAVLTIATAAFSTANAGLLAVNPNSIPGFTGTQAFNSTNLHVAVDFAVYAPGTYPGILGGVDPSAGADFVYAYQAFNIGAINDLPMSALTVVLGTGSGAHNAGVNGALGGANPLVELIQTNSFFSLFSPDLAPGQNSTIVLFTSPNPPVFGSASVADGGQSDQQLLPTPLVPEPASLGLLAVGGLVVAGRRRRA